MNRLFLFILSPFLLTQIWGGTFFLFNSSLHADLLQDGGDLPLWMETNRIQPVINTFYSVDRLPIRSGKLYRGNKHTEEIFSQGFLTLRSLGVNVATELFKDNWRPPSWPSAVPSQNSKNPQTPNTQASILNSSADVVLSLSKNAQENSLRLGGYYWMTGEGRPRNIDTHSTKSKLLYKSDTYEWNPPNSWFCKNLDGSLAAVTLPNGTIRGYYFDFSSEPYRQFTLQRFRELAYRNVSNIFFDERHQPNHEDDGCFGGATEAAYIKQFGKSELPRKKDFNDRKYRQYITFQGDKLAESFGYWKNHLEKEFGSRRPLFTINGLYLSGFTFPHMSLDLLDVADSVKVEFRNGVRDFISEGFKSPDIDPVFRSPTKIPRPPNDIRTAMALVIARDGADGRPFTSWAVEHDFDTQEKANVIHATVVAYGGIVAPNINYRNMMGVVLNTADKKQFKNNLKVAVSLVKQMESSLAFSRPYKFAAIHLSENERRKRLSSASIWRDIMWPIHGAFEFFIRKGLPASIITDKQILKGKLDEYKVIYFTVTKPQELAPQLQAKIKKFQQQGGLAFFRDSSYKVGQPSIKLEAFSKIISSSAPVQVNYGNDLPKNINPHAIFFTKNNGNTNLVAVLNDFTHVLHKQARSKNKTKPNPIRNARLLLNYKPMSVIDVMTGKALPIKRYGTNKYLIDIPSFQTVSLLSIQKLFVSPNPKFEVFPKHTNIKDNITAAIYLDEASCNETLSLDWKDGTIEQVKTAGQCPAILRRSHRYKKQGQFPVSLSYGYEDKTYALLQKVNITGIDCSLSATTNTAKPGEAIKLIWKTHGANTAILSHGVGPVALKGQHTVIAPTKVESVQYQLSIYGKEYAALCSATIKIQK